MTFEPEVLQHAVPGAFGSAVAQLFVTDVRWLKRIALFIGGVIFAHFASREVAPYTHLEDGFLLGAILGMCSMSFIAKCFETWQELNLLGWLTGILTDVRDVIRKKGGLPPVPSLPPPPATPPTTNPPQGK